MSEPTGSWIALSAAQSLGVPKIQDLPSWAEQRGALPDRLGANGLVSSSTSGTRRKPIRIEPRRKRLKTMRCRVLTGARLHTAEVNRWRAAFVTLTYAPSVDWDGRHISTCIHAMRQWLKRRNIRMRYVWVAEIQEQRKANNPEFHCVHYHLIVWLPWGVEFPFLDAQGWWPHGTTRVEWARSAVGYVSKYVSKEDGAYRLPKGARMYGTGGLIDGALQEARWWALPSWLRERVDLAQVIRRNRSGGGWVDLNSGEIFRSPWRVVFHGGSVWVYRDPDSCGAPSQSDLA